MQIDILMRVLADEKLTCHYFLNFNFEHKEKRFAKACTIEVMNLFGIPKYK